MKLPLTAQSTAFGTLLIVFAFASADSDAADPPAEPRWQIELSGGGRIVGNIAIRQVTLQTEFGPLTIPLADVQSLTPGLVSRPATERRVLSLIEKLGSPSFDEREHAQRELKTLGSRIRGFLEDLRTDGSPERRQRARKLLAEIGPKDDAGTPWLRRDVVVTAGQRIAGRIAPAVLDVKTQHGELHVPMGDVESLAPPPSRRAVDLLKQLDLTRDTVAGAWKWEGTTLVSPKTNRVRVQVPIVPPPEYELQLTVLPKEGRTHGKQHMADSLFIGMVVGGRQCYVALNAFADVGGPFAGLDMLEGKRTHLKFLHKGPVLELEREARIVCTVRRQPPGVSVAATVDGKPIFTWQGDPKQLSVSEQWRLADGRYLGLGSHQTVFEISRFELVPIDEPIPPRQLDPREFAVRLADGTFVAARADDAQTITLRIGDGERKLTLGQIKSWRKASVPGATTVTLTNDEVITGRVADQPIEWTTRFGRFQTSLVKTTHGTRGAGESKSEKNPE
jgi:hypothetical protein